VKQCSACKVVKPFDEFYDKGLGAKGQQLYSSWCKSCAIKTASQWQKDNPEQYRHNQLMMKFGISLQQLNELVSKQNNCCAICKKLFTPESTPRVDHCHTNGNIRGALCNSCNIGLGHFFDDPQILYNAAKYIEENAQQNPTTSLPTRIDQQGEVHSEHGVVPTAGTREDHHDTNDYRGAVSGENTYRSSKEGSRDSVAHRNKKVEPSRQFTLFEDNGDTEPEIVRIEFGSRRLFD